MIEGNKVAILGVVINKEGKGAGGGYGYYGGYRYYKK
jgi:hypothetical protein